MLRGTRAAGRTGAQSVLLALIWLYQRLLSPIFVGSCRFEPSCSEYARQAVLMHGPLRGGLLTLWRLSRCQPFCRGGHDPVPVGFSANISDTHAS
ncbi:MAG: membrane protein insertion efficiency factor YidD [Desulfovibrionaceae bacterium CG1_02_65_16]|nr:MAG: membrane protein insertion efficiency factor YidD [Desulfovibrionaceae bacterium CG1_02_65_16]